MSLDLILILSFAINSSRTLYKLVGRWSSSLALPFSPPAPLLCQILICLTDQFLIILRRIPMTHLEQVRQQTIRQDEGMVLPRAQ